MAFLERVKNRFITGLVLIAPIAVTAFVLKILAGWATQIANPIVTNTRLAQYTANDVLAARVLALVLVVVGITLLGYLAGWSVGRRLVGNVGRVVDFIPLVNTIYGSVRQVSSALVSRDSRYDRVVLVEYPRRDVYSIGLVTSESDAVVEAVTGGATYNVYLPNSPNPTAGRLVLLPEDQIHEIDMSVRQGIRTIVTTGMGDEDEVVPGLPADVSAPEAGDETS